jgi:hypothetical protein
MHRYEHPGQEKLVLFLERQCKSVDDTTQNLQKLCNTIESFRFVDKLEEYIVDGSPNIRTKVEEFAVNTV